VNLVGALRRSNFEIPNIFIGAKKNNIKIKENGNFDAFLTQNEN